MVVLLWLTMMQDGKILGANMSVITANHILNVKTVDEWLDEVSYEEDLNYIPSLFALEMINFIKMVNGEEGEENKTPVLHMKMLDKIVGSQQRIINMLYRGSAKTTLMGEYLFLYMAVYGEIPGFGEISIAIYVSDSIENGVKNMRKNLEYRWQNSAFLQKYIPETRFTDVRYEFTNIDGKKLIVKGYGAKTGVRGAKELGRRVDFALLDDLVSDEDARSPTVIKNIEDTVYKAINFALHPKKFKVIWNGTPFNQNDPLYKATESGAWQVSVYPVCEHFDDTTTKEDFRGAWPDRHDYEYVKEQYTTAKSAGMLEAFNQELMLRISSEEDRLVRETDYRWFEGEDVMNQEDNYNFYLTTDLSTSEKARADFRVLSLWAYNNNEDWFLMDGSANRYSIDRNIDMIFDYVAKHNIRSVGIETSGQQDVIVKWINKEMHRRNTYFHITEVKPSVDKLQRFQGMVPAFRQGKVWFNKDLIGSAYYNEMKNEVDRATVGGLQSRKDDVIDTISMLGVMSPWKPAHSAAIKEYNDDGGYSPYDDDEMMEADAMASYVV